eukprot:jgi/Chrpa1/18067/Chrysochromulina_OHIO_Genome00025503-RA
MQSAFAIRAGVDPSAVELTISPGSVIADVSIQTTTVMAASVQSTMASATSSPSSATAMLASVTGVSITVLAVVAPPTVADVPPPPPPSPSPPPPMEPPPMSTGASAVETSGSTGIIIGVIIGVSVLVLPLVILYCRRRETRRKLIVVTPADAPPKSSSDDGTSYSHSSASSSSDMVSSLTLGEKAAPERATTEGLECSFWFVNADSLRRAATPRLPMMQTLRTQEPHRLVQKTIGFVEGVRGAYKNILVVSHRWETPTDPDPDGVQALAVQDYLKAHPEIDAVWFDFCSMPQGRDKTPSESAEFKEMLPNINLLYLTCSVLILMDRTYMSRFWTQFEAYLSMRAITSDGLTNALDPQARARVTIMTLHDLPPSMGTVLVDEWSNKTPEKAHAILAGQDVIVTNQSDKDIQLAKLKVLNERAQRAFARSRDA